MSKLETPSVTNTRGDFSSHNTWVKSQQKDSNQLIWGRIQDNGTNFIVEGWDYGSKFSRTRWVKIPCQNLATAQLLIGDVMPKDAFQREKTRQNAWSEDTVFFNNSLDSWMVQ